MRRKFWVAFAAILTLIPVTAFAQGDVPDDGRLNLTFISPYFFYCSLDAQGGLEVYTQEGTELLDLSRRQIEGGLGQAAIDNQPVQVANSGGLALIAYPDGTVTGQGFEFRFTVPGNACGGFTADYSAIIAQLVDDVANQFNDAPVVVAPASSTPIDTTTASASNFSGQVHVVQQGENLFRIGLRYGVPFRQLAAFNGIADPTRIVVGQEIRIP